MLAATLFCVDASLLYRGCVPAKPKQLMCLCQCCFSIILVFVFVVCYSVLVGVLGATAVLGTNATDSGADCATAVLDTNATDSDADCIQTPTRSSAPLAAEAEKSGAGTAHPAR